MNTTVKGCSKNDYCPLESCAVADFGQKDFMMKSRYGLGALRS